MNSRTTIFLSVKLNLFSKLLIETTITKLVSKNGMIFTLSLLNPSNKPIPEDSISLKKVTLNPCLLMKMDYLTELKFNLNNMKNFLNTSIDSTTEINLTLPIIFSSEKPTLHGKNVLLKSELDSTP